MKTSKLDEFKEKLKELMEEYRAEIGVEWGDNDGGVYGPWVCLSAAGCQDEMYDVINDLTL